MSSGMTSISNFNPRSRQGSDFIDVDLGVALDISIHAPVKGATRSNRPANIKAKISIHAPVKGATRGRSLSARLLAYFNPRSREGSDGLVFGSFRG